MKELHLGPKDFKLEWYSGTGAGGQHRNKHQNCCRITHIDSGLTSNGTNSKERVANQREAFNNLSKKVLAWYYGDGQKERFNATSNLVRRYHAVRNEVKDIESSHTDTFTNVIDKSGLDNMIKNRKQSLQSDAN